ncbi:uncharacterized protein [Gossypium hirsutum]|uniref:Gag-pro-like protein n=1 Tax=Gossypium hirsutum TaxID=3635 RepID=A0A1U8PVN8_GOSHI|nr:uncharacterized protein LOC107963115 [Gossypium hirsutum]
MKQYGHVTDIAPDQITLQNIEKNSNESFRQYVQSWREVTTQVQPPLLEKETTMLFINILKVPFINHMLGGAIKSFTDIVMSGEMIENAIRSKKIETGESARRSASKKRENEVGNPPYPKWYDASAQCEYHAGITGHSIENCTSFKRVVERLINVGVVKFDEVPSAGNPLPNHTVNGINTVNKNMGRRVKLDIAEVRTLMREVLKKMVERGLIIQDFGSKSREVGNYCEFHGEEDHEIETCNGFRALVQGLMDNKEMEFFEFAEEKHVCALEKGLIKKKPAAFPYKDNKRVPWSYNCNVTLPGERRLASTPDTEVLPVKEKSLMSKRGEGRTKPLVNEPVTADKAKEFLKFLKHSEYSVVEQLHKQPARTSILALLQNSEAHRNTLMKVLNETYIAEDISVNKLNRLVNNISADNFISFSDDEIPPDGMGSTKALHITIRCKGYTLLGVLIDNGSALNVLPLSTLSRLPIDSSHMRMCQNIVRAFDGTERKVMGRIEIPLLIGPNTYEVDFLVMDIRPSYNCLLGRPWIHSARVVPSSLHQRLKLVTEGQLITVNAEEDIIAPVASDTPYIESDDETI